MIDTGMQMDAIVDHRRECFTAGGWNLADDDASRVPECEPMASGQRKRYLRESAPAAGTQAQLN
jgi:hypothetical protein